MYFHSRAQAGRILAKELLSFGKQNCSVLALSPGGVIIGAQIAMKVHANLNVLLTENIVLPGENEPLAAISAANTFTYNNMFSTGQIEEMTSEYLTYIEQERTRGLSNLHRVLGADGEIHRELLRRQVVILVSDGLNTALSLDVAADFLKPVDIRRLVIATPIASVQAVDRMHLLSDEIHCLKVLDNYINTNHYYNDNTIPDTEHLLKIIRHTPIYWQHPARLAGKA